MSKKTAPEEIISAAAGMLAPYYPGLSVPVLVEALKHRDQHQQPTPTFRKPLTRREAAEVLQVSLATINRYIKAGTLKASKIGKRLVRINPASVEALMQTCYAGGLNHVED